MASRNQKTRTRATVTGLRCEWLVNPTAIDSDAPRLSWVMEGPERGAAQTAYRVLAADSPEALAADDGNLWDSSRVESGRSLHIGYAGAKLESCRRAFCRVMTWDQNGQPTAWSDTAEFTMGLLNREDWQGVYIGNHLGMCNASPLLRKEFAVKKRVKRALLHVTAQGLYRVAINGSPAHDDVLAPGWTDYNKRRHYRCHDVTALLPKRGKVCIGAELGEGWFKGRITWGHRKESYGDRTALLAQLRVEYVDGSVEIVPTDTSWKTIFGPIRRSGFYDGESVDAQLEPEGWRLPGFNDKRWESAVRVRTLPKNIPLASYPAEPVRITEELKPVGMWDVAPGKTIYDFGQNFAGRVRLHFKGKAGAVVQMRFGEMVNGDKSLYVDNLRSAVSTDTYVMRGDGREVWEPTFTFHGFRYVEVSGCPVRSSLKNVTGVVLGSDTARVGRFECSSKLVNQIYKNAVWTQRANFIDVPTDCPQRDERLGWTGDAQVFIRTAICNMDVAAFFTKWMDDLIDAQTPEGAFTNVAPQVLSGGGDAAWGDAGVVCPWTLYRCYKDRELLANMYPHMKAWVAYLKKTSRKLIRSPDLTHCFGDWLSIKANTPKDVIQTAHFAHATDITRKAAEALGKKGDAKRYQKLFADIKSAFNKAFVKSDGSVKGETQTAYLMALKFDLLTPKRAEQAARHLVADIRKRKHHLSTGFVGTALIMSVLRDIGKVDLAYRLLENTTFPSWGYSVVNGATTIWERWNGWTKEGGPGDVNMNSYSHYAYGAVVEWMFDTIAGIDHGACGFREFVLRPMPGGSLRHASASYRSPYGMIKSAWRKSGKRMRYSITIPANTTATVFLPVRTLKGVKLDGKALASRGVEVRDDGGFVLRAGKYSLSW